jgi:hypothetical protein
MPPDPELIGRARQIGEAQVDPIRVARARRDIISAAMADPDDRPATGLTVPIATPGKASDPGTDKRVTILSGHQRAPGSKGTNASRCRGASAPSARSTLRAGRLHAAGGEEGTIILYVRYRTVRRRIRSKRTNFGIPNEINTARSPRRSRSNSL